MLTLFSKWRAKRRVLAWVNDVRLTYGRDALAQLPKGTPRAVDRYFSERARACVIAEAVEGFAGLDECQPFDRYPTWVPYPEHVARFVLDFDRGEYPELIYR